MWGAILGGLASAAGSAAGGYFQGEAYKDAASVAARSAQEARAMQQAQIERMMGLTATARDRGNQATDMMGTATGLNGAAAQQEYAASLANDPNYKSQQAYADREALARINAQGGSTLGGNAQAALHAQDTAGLNAFGQQRYTNLGTLQQGGLASLSPLANVMNTAGTGAANATMAAGQAQASGITNSASSLIGGLQGAIRPAVSGLQNWNNNPAGGGFAGSTAIA